MALSAIKDDKASLAEKAAEQIIQYIQDNRLKPGDKLPVETELEHRLNVSRSTIRAAMYSLRTSGIVYVRQGSGTYVADMVGVADDPLGLRFKYDHQKAIKELLELRSMLEPQIAAYCARCASDDDKKAIVSLARKVENAINSGNDYIDYDIEFHCKIAESTGNSLLNTLIPEITRGIKLFAVATKGHILQETIITHRELADAILAGDATAAYAAMAKHLKYNETEILRSENSADSEKG